MARRRLLDGVRGRIAARLRPRDAKRRVFDSASVVASLYEALLDRRPDAGGLAGYSGALERGTALAGIMGEFLRSKEFARRVMDTLDRYPLDLGGPMRVELNDATDERAALWRHVAEVWAGYGETDPYWSVLTAERWRAANMTSADVLEEFYASGSGALHRLDTWLARNAIELGADAVCAEYGCGVGRCTVWLARRFRRVVAFDVSQPHLDAARAAMTARGIDNVEFVLVRGPDDLARLKGVDLFYSILVLQHNPPSIIVDILGSAFEGLERGGAAFFQIPTYADDYSFKIDDYNAGVRAKKQMEMHFVPQRTVFDLAARHRLLPVEVQPDDLIGRWGSWISNTFLMRKTG